MRKPLKIDEYFNFWGIDASEALSVPAEKVTHHRCDPYTTLNNQGCGNDLAQTAPSVGFGKEWADFTTQVGDATDHYAAQYYDCDTSSKASGRLEDWLDKAKEEAARRQEERFQSLAFKAQLQREAEDRKTVVANPLDVQEEILPIPGCPDYHVSSLGKIYSEKPFRHNAKPAGLRELTYSFDKDGYRRVAFYLPDDEKRYARVCRVVCEVFNGPPFEGAVARHLDGNNTNDIPTNLKWGTPQENSDDKYLHGTMIVGEQVNTNKLKEEEVREIYYDPRKYVDIAKDYGITYGMVGHIKNRRSWKHVSL